MTLSKYTNNLYQSEVYRELERQAVKKGFFKPTDAELVKLAAQEVIHTQQINQPIDDTPSDDLIQDVARLAYAMRRKGFVTQAEDIEQKLVMYKTAENALYNVTQETNADLIGFAHRDGDVNLIEGSGDLGTFETLQSVADKILAVTKKQPTGKQPMNRMAALAAMINKVAQDTDFTPPVSGSTATSANKTRTEIIESAKEYIAKFDQTRKTPPSYNGLVFDLEKHLEQIQSYIYFSGKKADANSILIWFRLKATARKLGVLIEGNIPSLDINKLYQMIAQIKLSPGDLSIEGASQSLQNALMNRSQSLIALASIMGVLPEFQTQYLSPTSTTYLLEGGLGVGINQNHALAACKFLGTAASNIYNLAFGPDNAFIATAQNAISSIIDTLYKKLESIKIEIKSPYLVNDVVRNLARISREIGAAQAEFKKQPTYTYLLNINKDIIGSIDKWVSDMKADMDTSYSGVTTEQMKIANIDSTGLEESYEFLSTKTDDKSKIISDKIGQLIEVIGKYNGQPWVELQEALKNSSLKIIEPSIESFQKSIQTIVNSVRSS